MTAEAPTALRTEVEIVADTVTALIHAGLIRSSATAISVAARETGIEINDLRLAEERWRAGLPRLRPRRAPTVPHVDPAPAPRGRAAAGKNHTPVSGTSLHGVRTTDKYGRLKNPTPDTRRCSICDEVKPITGFSVKNQATGSLRSYCKDCQSVYHRARWLTVQKLERLGEVGIGLVALEGDAVIGLVCPCCDQPICAGDLYRVDGLPTHRDCLPLASSPPTP